MLVSLCIAQSRVFQNAAFKVTRLSEEAAKKALEQQEKLKTVMQKTIEEAKKEAEKIQKMN